MRFVIAMNDTQGAWDALSSTEQARILDEHRSFRAALEREDALVDVLHLSPPGEAKTVERDADGEVSVENGLRIHGAEHLGAFYVVDVTDEAEALAWTRRSRFMVGTNVLRRIVDETAAST